MREQPVKCPVIGLCGESVTNGECVANFFNLTFGNCEMIRNRFADAVGPLLFEFFG